MSTADVVLSSIKQQAQYFKKHLNTSLNQTYELIARANGFANWHELCAVAKS